MEKLFRVFAVVVFAHSMFAAGTEFADNQVNDGVANLILAAFFLAYLLIEWFARGHKLQSLSKSHDKADDIFKQLGRVFDEVDAKRKEEEKAIGDAIHNSCHEVLNNRKPKQADIPKIEKLFHEKMPGRWLKLKLNKTGKFDAEVSTEPFTKPAPGRSTAHTAAAKRGDKARAKAAVKKPVTKKKGSK